MIFITTPPTPKPRLCRNTAGNGADPNDDDFTPVPSTTSPYYTLSNRSSHHHQQLTGIAELPVSASALPSTATDPFSFSTTTKGTPIDSQNGGARNRFSYSSSTNGAINFPDVIDISQQQQQSDGTSLDFRQHHHHQKQYSSYIGPPPYRNPPQTLHGGSETSINGGGQTRATVQLSPQSVPDSPVDAYHTHSAKFPIVKEVIISETEIRNTPTASSSTSHAIFPPERSFSSGTLPRCSSSSTTATSSSSSSVPPTQPPPLQTSSTTLLTPEYIKKFQNKKLTKHLAWKDERRALTLDSETAKELQNQLAAQQQKSLSSGTSTIRRSGSAFELEKLIEAFNQEQHALVMSSLHQGLVPKRRLDGIDNPALDIGGPHNNSLPQTSSSLQNGHPLHNGGSCSSSQNPHSFGSSSSPPGGKMAGYSFSDSSASQSLSLSSSNTDSLDTVIYKGPNAAAPSIRDWQRSKDSLQQSDFGHRADTSSYRADSQGIFDNRSYPMPQSSAASSSVSYQPMQFNGPGGGNVVMSGQTPSVMVGNGYSMEYRHQQQQQQQQVQQQQHHHQQQHQQNLSVQSVHQSQQLHQQHQNGGMMMRQPNGTSSASQHQSPFSGTGGVASQSPMLPTKSPMVTHKTLLPPPGPSPSSSSNQSVPSVGGGGGGSVPSSNLKSNINGNGGDPSSSVGLDKAKDSTKMFPTKTYNHIKDMISSRFGNGNSNNNNSANSSGALPPKGLNNSNVVNNNNNPTGNNSVNQSGNTNGGFVMNGQNGANSYLESPMGLPTYGMNQHGHMHSHSIHDSFGGGTAPPAPYYTSPPAVSPQNGNGSANTYRSPPMNDRKNVNTSFRKAIHQSTLKSNLTEESLQLRPIMESGNMNGSNRDLYRGGPQYSQQQTGDQTQPRYGLGHEPHSPSLIPHHVERAQRALDKLCEPGGLPFTRTGSGPMTHQNGIGRMVQQFSGSGATTNEESSGGINSITTSNRPMYSLNGKIGAMSSASSGASQLTTGGEPGAIPRNRFSVTPGPSSSTSNSSGGLGANAISTAASNSSAIGGVITVESSLSSPSSSSYTHSSSGGGGGNNKQSLGHQQHQAPTASLANGNSNNGSSSNNNNKSNTNNDQLPPPLPTSQKPEVSGASGHSNHHHLFQNSTNGSSNHHNTLGLPPVLPSVLVGEKRENGDGSSGTMENPSSANLHLESSQGATTTASGAGPSGTGNASSSALASNKSKSEQLKKITADLHNLAISVAAEQHFHHSHHHLQFASGSGSGASSAGNNNQNSNNNINSNNNNSSSSECENKGSQRIGSGQSHTTSDSGVGTVMLTKSPLNSISDHENNCKTGGSADLILVGEDHHVMDSVSSGNDSEWVDIVEPEIRQILELEKKSKPGKSRMIGDKMSGVPNGNLTTSTPAHLAQVHHAKGAQFGINGKNGEQPDLMGDITASPIPHHRVVSGSPNQSPKLPKKFDLNAYNKKAGQNRSQELLAGPSTSAGVQNGVGPSSSKVKSPRSTTKVNRSNSGAQRYGRTSRGDKGAKNTAAAANRLIKDLGLKGIKLSRHAASQILYPQDDNGDMTSTTTGLDLESMLDGQTEQTSDDDDDMSTTIDTTDAHAIRRQLESLESMYTEVLKVLGAKRFSGNRYPTSDLRNAKRRPYGSMSSLPSSVSSRPFRERKLKLDDKKKVKDIKSINKRFQRLESHVVTLARSVAHLSSEMRTQHLMVQEIESIRNEMQQLRNQVLKSTMQNQSAAAAAAQNFARVSSGRNGAGVNLMSATDWTSFRNALPSLTNPCRVRKLTKFFGDEPPLVRIFLKKLGYEKYASAFEQERIGIMELPYLTEERLNKMGIPMGPRLRILQEAQLCLKPGYHPNHDTHHSHHQSNNHGPGNLSVYVV